MLLFFPVLYIILVEGVPMYPARLLREPLASKNQTGKRMHVLIRRFNSDLSRAYIRKNGRLVPLASLPLPEYFNLIKDLPYRRDKKPVEVIARPAILLRGLFSGLDCKKKAIMIASWLRRNGRNKIPGYRGYRLVSVSTRPDKKIHHVFPQVNISGRWLNLDATYPDYRMFQRKIITKAEVLKP